MTSSVVELVHQLRDDGGKLQPLLRQLEDLAQRMQVRPACRVLLHLLRATTQAAKLPGVLHGEACRHDSVLHVSHPLHVHACPCTQAADLHNPGNSAASNVPGKRGAW